MEGPGKYDDEATKARVATFADGVALIVLNGVHGSGFSVQAPLHVLKTMPEILRALADEIERSDSKPQ